MIRVLSFGLVSLASYNPANADHLLNDDS